MRLLTYNRDLIFIAIVLLLHVASMACASGTMMEDARNKAFSKDYDGAIAIYDTMLREDPDNLDALNGKARVLSWKGEYESAAGLYESVLKGDPDNAESITGLADIHAWQKKYHDALILLKRGIDHNPDNREILIRLARVNIWQGNKYESLIYINKLLDQDPLDNDAKVLRKQAYALYSYEAYLGYSYLDINNNDNGDNVFAGLKYDPGKKYSLYGQVDYLNRFSEQEVKVLGGMSYDVTDKLTVSFEVNAAPDALVYPRVSGSIEVSYPVLADLVLYGNFRAAEYRDVDLRGYTFAMEYYLGKWSALARYTLSETGFDTGGNSTDDSIYAKITHYFNDTDEAYVYYAYGSESYKIETIDSLGDIEASIYGVGVTYFIHPAIGLSPSFEFQDRAEGTEYMQSGLKIKFRI